MSIFAWLQLHAGGGAGIRVQDAQALAQSIQGCAVATMRRLPQAGAVILHRDLQAPGGGPYVQPDLAPPSL